MNLASIVAARARGTGGGGGGDGAICSKHLVARTRSSAMERTYTHTERSSPSGTSMLFSAAVVMGTHVSACWYHGGGGDGAGGKGDGCGRE